MENPSLLLDGGCGGLRKQCLALLLNQVHVRSAEDAALAGDILGDLYHLLAHAQPRGIVALPSTSQCIQKAQGQGQEASASPVGPGTCSSAACVGTQCGSQFVLQRSLHTLLSSCTPCLGLALSMSAVMPL